jgi:hypothetical protein
LTLLEGLKTGKCRSDIKINIIDSPLKGLTLASLIHRHQDKWCSSNTMKNDKYFDDFFNDVAKHSGKCGRDVQANMRRFGTSVGALVSSGLRFKSVEGNVKAMKAMASLETYSSIRAAEEGTPPMNIMGRSEDQQLAMLEMAGTASAKDGTTKGFIHAFDKLSHERQVSLIEFLHAWGMEHEENLSNEHAVSGMEMLRQNPLNEWSKNEQLMLIETFRQTTRSTARRLFTHRRSKKWGKIGKAVKKVGKAIGKGLKAVGKAVVKVGKAVVKGVVKVAKFVHKKIIKPTISFVKKKILAPIVSAVANAVAYLAGFGKFNPREQIGKVLKETLCGKADARQKLEILTGDISEATVKDLGIVDKTIL